MLNIKNIRSRPRAACAPHRSVISPPLGHTALEKMDFSSTTPVTAPTGTIPASDTHDMDVCQLMGLS